MVEIISVRFKSGGKQYYFNPNGEVFQPGEGVIVETSRGVEYGECTQGNTPIDEMELTAPLRPVLRRATEEDEKVRERNKEKEAKAFQICQEKIAQHGLEMKLVEAEYSFEGNKVLFFFTAEGRVDFRALVKDLASAIHARIELRQIGVRDEAKMLGGLGICGRPFCCSQFMDEFLPVSIKMAKTQSLSLNPTKISGTCGRLMCCLKYEQDAYEDAIKRMPKNDSFVLTPDGPGNVSDVNLLKETVNVRLDDRPEGPRCYHNCEVCVLRNGKGSRDGIAIPDQWPERYVEPVKEDEMPPISFISDFTPVPADKPEEGEKRRRRSRGGRDRKKSEGAGAPEKRGDKPAKAEKPAKSDKPAKAEKPEKKERTDKPASRSGSRRRGRRGGGGGSAASASGSTQQTAPRPNKPQENQSAKSGGDQRKRPRHRGGRRKNGGGKSGAGTEA